MIDEYPVLAVAAAFAEGDDADARPARIARQGIRPPRRGRRRPRGRRRRLHAIEGDDLIVEGGGGAVRGGGLVATHLDHRIAMSFLVMGLASQEPIAVDDGAMIATSFPSFRPLMDARSEARIG